VRPHQHEYEHIAVLANKRFTTNNVDTTSKKQHSRPNQPGLHTLEIEPHQPMLA
jgi:hypothetical protein